MRTESADVVVVGAGISGLACARELASRGARVIVLDRSRGVGGRCATRRVEGRPVDHGLLFLHGTDPGFHDALRAVDAEAATWPVRVEGRGTACHPAAFREAQFRIAFADGVSVLPKHLARGLDVRLRVEVRGVQLAGARWRVEEAGRGTFEGRHLVLALPVESALALLESSPVPPSALRAARGLLSLVGSVPCLTVIAGYPAAVPEPWWHVAYPERSAVLQLAAHDSSKRRAPDRRVLVLQARPSWSASRGDADPGAWSREILDAAARDLGTWIGNPSWVQAHRWRHARVGPGETFASPLVVPCPPAGSLGLAGEAFDAAAGAEGAYRSGIALARALSTEA